MTQVNLRAAFAGDNDLLEDAEKIQALMKDGFVAALDDLEKSIPAAVASAEEEWPRKALTQCLVQAETFAGLNTNVPIYVAVLSGKAFGEYAEKGALFKDVGAGVLHGEYTHRIHWYVVFHAMTAGFTDEEAKNRAPKGWHYTPKDLLVSVNINRLVQDADAWPKGSQEIFRGLWDALFDRARIPETFSFAEDGISSPEDFNFRLLDKEWLKANHNANWKDLDSRKDAAFGAFNDNWPKLGRICARRFAKRKGQGFTGTIVPKGYIEDKLTAKSPSTQYQPGSEATVLEMRIAEEKKKKHCFLTTACVEARGLPDDCHELEVLRAFRDGYLRSRPGGQALVEAYYALAPRILQQIRRSADAPAVLDGIHETVRRAVAQIEHGDDEGAVATYAAMVDALSSRFLR